MQYSIVAIISLVSATMAAPSTIETRTATATNLNIPKELTHGNACFTYMGCYVDNANRLVGSEKTMLSASGPQDCINKCSARGGKWAALEYGGQCFCDEKLNYGGTKRPDAECNYKCKTEGLACGGFWRAQVYHIQA